MQSNGNKCPMNGNGVVDDMSYFERPDQISKCTWKLGMDKTAIINPHTVRPRKDRPKICDNILEVIGNTPLIKLNRIPEAEGIKCQLYAKCEFLNPGGSVKDRIGYRMVIDAENKNLLSPGCTIIEPTSGNTGIGLAMACAVKGYNCVIVMPEKMSDEKVGTLRSLGAKIIRTPTEAAFDSPEGLIAVAQRLKRDTPNSHILNQYRHSGNPLAHYDGTGAEIIYQCNGNVDMVVIGAGTGGTVSGVGRKIREDCPQCKIVSFDPEGSILAEPEELNVSDVTFYEIEGIGYDFIPTVLDREVVDKWIKVNDKDSLTMARRLQREEGILCGGSSGAALHAAIQAIKDLGMNHEDKKCVVLLPDSIRNYMSKFVQDSWMEARDLKESVNVHNYPWWDNKIPTLNYKLPQTVTATESCSDVINKLKDLNIEQIPLVDANGEFKGMITQTLTFNKMLTEKLPLTTPIGKFIYKQYRKVNPSTSIGHLSRILERESFVVVTQEKKSASNSTIEVPVGVITKADVLNYILKVSN